MPVTKVVRVSQLSIESNGLPSYIKIAGKVAGAKYCVWLLVLFEMPCRCFVLSMKKRFLYCTYYRQVKFVGCFYCLPTFFMETVAEGLMMC